MVLPAVKSPEGTCLPLEGGGYSFKYRFGCPLFDAAAHESTCSSLVERKVEISVLGLIDAMGVLPVANFITVLFAVQTNYSS